MKTFRRLAATIGFILIFLFVLSEVSTILMHKQIEGRWNMTAKVAGFYNEKPDSMDVLFFGSSHMYCSIDPQIFYQETGLESYVFATQLQPLWITYHYMLEALKTQKPQLMAVEINMAAYNDGDYLDEATNHTAIDPIPMSLNKLRMIYASAPKDERRYYIFNVMKYHDRWEELEQSDYERIYRTSTDPDKGYVRLDQIADEIILEDAFEVAEKKEISKKNVEYLNKIIELAESEGIKLILFKAPSNPTVEEKMYYNKVGELAKEREVEYIDFNSNDHYVNTGLDCKTDFYDQRHLNESGVAKFVPYFVIQVGDG